MPFSWLSHVCVTHITWKIQWNLLKSSHWFTLIFTHNNLNCVKLNRMLYYVLLRGERKRERDIQIRSNASMYSVCSILLGHWNWMWIDHHQYERFFNRAINLQINNNSNNNYVKSDIYRAKYLRNTYNILSRFRLWARSDDRISRPMCIWRVICWACMTHIICILYEWWILIWHIHFAKRRKSDTSTN